MVQLSQKSPIPEVIRRQIILVFQNIWEKVLLRSACWLFLGIPSSASKISSIDNLLIPRIPTITGSSLKAWQKEFWREEESPARFPPGIKIAFVTAKALPEPLQRTRSERPTFIWELIFEPIFEPRVVFLRDLFPKTWV